MPKLRHVVALGAIRVWKYVGNTEPAEALGRNKVTLQDKFGDRATQSFAKCTGKVSTADDRLAAFGYSEVNRMGQPRVCETRRRISWASHGATTHMFGIARRIAMSSIARWVGPSGA